jgi:hypothetical protein
MTKKLALVLFAASAVWAQPLVVSVNPQATQKCCVDGLQIVIAQQGGDPFINGEPSRVWFTTPSGDESDRVNIATAITDSSISATLLPNMLEEAGTGKLTVEWVISPEVVDHFEIPYVINPEPVGIFPDYADVATGRPFSIQMTVEPNDSGTPPFQWSLAPGGSTISGVSISPSGRLTGQFANPTGGWMSLTAQDASGYVLTGEFYIEAVDPPRITSVTPNPITPNCCDGWAELTIQATFEQGDYYPQVRYGRGSTQLDGLQVVDAYDTHFVARFPTTIEPGVYWIEMEAQVTSERYPIALGAPVVLPEMTLAPAVVGSSYQQEIAASGGVPPLTMTASGLPLGIAISGTSLYNIPREEGTFSVLVTVRDAIGQTAQRTYTLEVVPALSIVTTSLPAGAQGQAYSQTLAAAGGMAPYQWSLSAGTLPPGLSLDAETGLISGIPSEGGVYTFTAVVRDSARGIAGQTLSIAIGPSQPAHLPPAFLDVPYSATLPDAGIVPPYTWSISEGSLPPGLQLASATGEISGTPVETGTFTFTATVAGAQAQHTAAFIITVSPALVIRTKDAGHAVVNTPHSVALYASGGTPPYVWSLAGGNLPPGMSMGPEQITGVPTETGTYTFTVQVYDANGSTASRQLAMLVTEQPLLFTLNVANAQAGSQGNLAIGISAPETMAGSGTVTLSFEPDPGMPDDPAIQFSPGSMLSLTGGRAGTFAYPGGVQVNAPFQTGTVAGTISFILDGAIEGVGVASTPPVRTVRIEPAPPVLTGGSARRTANGLEVTVNGFATSRNITSATFRFTAASGATIHTSEVTVQLGSAFSEWYNNPASRDFGSQFQYVQPFTVDGDTQGIMSVAVTLTNAQGTSTPLILNF